MSETRSGVTSIKVKSATMLAQMIAWTQDEFYPSNMSPLPVEATRPSAQTVDTVDFRKLDEDNDWSEV